MILRRFIYPAIIIFFAVLAGFSLLHSGLPPTHDGEYHVVRFYEFDKVLRDGNFYPRWAPDLNNGYGVPLFNYVYPFPNYFASFLHVFNISFIDAFKLNMFFATIIGAMFFYFWSRIFWGNLGGLVSSIFYIFSPYRFVDIYVRGSVGEVWALAFFPAFLWTITIFMREKKKLYGIFSSIFLALTIFSHNILALIFFVFGLFYIAFLIYSSTNKKSIILNSLFFILLGLGLSAIFWLPALFEKSYALGLQIYTVLNNFPEIYQVIFPSWGSGFSDSGSLNQMSFQIGLANLIAVFISFIVLLFIKNKKLIIFFLFFFLLNLFLMTEISSPIWKTVPFMNYFQFPWRLLSLEILISAFLAGSIFTFKKTYFFSIPLIFIAVFLSIGYTKPAYYHNRDDQYYISRSNFINGTNSSGNTFNTFWFDRKLKKTNNKLEFEKKASIASQEIRTQKYKFTIKADEDQKVILNTAYFPGWTVFINNKREKILNSKDGRILFSLPKGESNIEVVFQNTLARNLGTFISFASFFILLLLIKKFSVSKK